jgi:hypothetical protein
MIVLQIYLAQALVNYAGFSLDYRGVRSHCDIVLFAFFKNGLIDGSIVVRGRIIVCSRIIVRGSIIGRLSAILFFIRSVIV